MFFFFCRRPVKSLLRLDVSSAERCVLHKTWNFFQALYNLCVVKLFITSRCVCDGLILLVEKDQTPGLFSGITYALTHVER